MGFVLLDLYIYLECLCRLFFAVADQGYQVRGGGALKKIAPSGGRRENCWGISCEKSRFYAKKSYFFQFYGGARRVRPRWIRPCFVPLSFLMWPLSVHLRFTDSDYRFRIFKLFMIMLFKLSIRILLCFNHHNCLHY